MNDEKINWFGTSIKSTAKTKNTSVNFLGGSQNKTTYKKNIPKNINFFGFNKKNSYKMKPSSLFRKESIKNKKLSKWGDADLDGTPNYFDCDARKDFKDAKSFAGYNRDIAAQRIIDKVAKEDEIANKNINIKPLDIKGKVAYEDKIAKQERKAVRKEYRRKKIDEIGGKIKNIVKKIDKIGGEVGGKVKNIVHAPTIMENIKGLSIIEKNFRPSSRIKSQLEEHKKSKGKLEKEYEIHKGILDQKLKDELITPKQHKEKTDKLEKQKVAMGKKQEKITKVVTATEKIKGLMKTPGLGGQAALLRYSIEEAQARGKTPNQKELAKLAVIERKTKMFGDIQQEGKFSRDILTKVPGGQIGRVLSGAGVTKSGEYSDALKAKSQRMRRMTAVATGALFGDNILRTRNFDSEPRARGRPPGPSGDYTIGGKPVYEADFQAYAVKQNALNRMLPTNVQSQTLNPEYIAYMKAKAIAEQQGLGEGQMENPELTRARQIQQMNEDGVAMTEEGMPMEAEVPTEETMPTTGTSMMQSGQEQELIRQKRAYTRAMPDEIKMAQQQAQQMDNVLNAPNFMKGELKATGGSVLTPIGPSILEAPNSFKGEMRNVTKPNIEEGEVKLGERPQTNPYGSEYLDIELGSGKPVLRRRITEKWMDGRAL